MAVIMAITLSSACEKDSITDEFDETIDNLPNITGFYLVGINQFVSYNSTTIITNPTAGTDFFGPNSNCLGTTPSYTNNGDGAVSDNETDLMGQNTLERVEY